MTNITNFLGKSISCFSYVYNFKVIYTQFDLFPNANKKDGGMVFVFGFYNTNITLLNHDFLRDYNIFFSNDKFV